MIVLVLNRSRKKSFRSSKRIISSVLPSITNRLNIGDIPQRIIIDLIKDLRNKVNRGTSIEVYIQDKSGYHGFKLVQIGKTKKQSELFTIPSKIDLTLINEGIIKKQ
ncbi:TPA: hypothetical protein NV714_003517 [Escherichia coli]|nr:hypothetical protein [Escherichia coli]